MNEKVYTYTLVHKDGNVTPLRTNVRIGYRERKEFTTYAIGIERFVRVRTLPPRRKKIKPYNDKIVELMDIYKRHKPLVKDGILQMVVASPIPSISYEFTCGICGKKESVGSIAQGYIEAHENGQPITLACNKCVPCSNYWSKNDLAEYYAEELENNGELYGLEFGSVKFSFLKEYMNEYEMEWMQEEFSVNDIENMSYVYVYDGSEYYFYAKDERGLLDPIKKLTKYMIYASAFRSMSANVPIIASSKEEAEDRFYDFDWDYDAFTQEGYNDEEWEIYEVEEREIDG